MLKIRKVCNPSVDAILRVAAEQIESVLHEPVLLRVYEPPFELQTIIAIVCDQLQISEGDVKGESRRENIKDARHIACYLAQNTGCYTSIQIAKWLGYDHHTPVIRACKRIKDMLDTQDPKVTYKINLCKSHLYNLIPENNAL